MSTTAEQARAYLRGAAFLNDLLASLENDPDARRKKATTLRESIVRDLPATASWWNVASRAEALVGLRR